MSEKKLKIIIIPDKSNYYDYRMVSELAKAFNSIGQDAKAIKNPVSDTELVKLCEIFSIDVIIQINKIRPLNIKLPNNVRHISWFQDVFLNTAEELSEGIQSGDILYTLGEPSVLGINTNISCYSDTLFTGVDTSTLNYQPKSSLRKYDFSFCGYMPSKKKYEQNVKQDIYWYLNNYINKLPIIGNSLIFWILRKIIFRKILTSSHVPYAAIRGMINIVENIYKPLNGELDIHKLKDLLERYVEIYVGNNLGTAKKIKNILRASQKVQTIFHPYSEKFNNRNDFSGLFIRFLSGDKKILTSGMGSEFHSIINYLAHTYPRFLDRKTLIDEVLKFTDSIGLYGSGWDEYEEYKPYFNGFIDDKNQLLDIYHNSKINLANNTHGLGLHSRVLECMAVCGFVFLHESPNDNKAGGILTAFEPSVHYGVYRSGQIEHDAHYWLMNNNHRIKVGYNARKLILESHTWRHRARQILIDLKR